MKSLLYKDLVNLKHQMRYYAIFLVIYGLISLKQQNGSLLGGVMVIFAVMLSVTAYAYDEKAGWDSYALTMPFGVRELVVSKYALSGLGILAAVVLVSILNAVSGCTLRDMLGMAASFGAVGLFYMDFLLPVIFRFGVEKGRTLMLLIILLPTALILLADQTSFLQNMTVAQETVERAALFAPAVGLALVPLSVAYSMKMYRKKEY